MRMEKREEEEEEEEEKMNEYYCIFKRTDQSDVTRRVVIEKHGRTFCGELGFQEEELSCADVQKCLARLQRKRKTLEEEKLSKNDPFHAVAGILEETSNFIRDEVVDAQDVLEEMAQYGMTAWINSEGSENDTYFELKARNAEHLPDVELACAKMYIGTLKVHIVFLQGSYYCTMNDVASSEQALDDEEFPDISSRGTGFQIKSYLEDQEFTKLALWQLVDEQALNMRRILQERRSSLEGKHSSSAESKMSHVVDDGESIHEDLNDISHINDEYLWGKCKEAFGGSYTQTYLMLKPEPGKGVQRRALFRYGNWCYGGYVEMDQDVTLHEIPHVLRKFQRQQGKLSYWFEVQQLPDGLPFSKPMKHFAMGSAFLEEQILKAETTLSQLTEYHIKKGIQPWINEENGCQFFELETSGDQLHYDEVDLMASKTYFKEVVVITIYYRGSFYLTLSPSVDDQPLLDMSFPDVEARGRALQIATYSHSEFKKLMLWESTRSVWETANKAVLEQRRQAALKREREVARQQEQEQQQHRQTSCEQQQDEEGPAAAEEEEEILDHPSESKSGIESKEENVKKIAKQPSQTSPTQKLENEPELVQKEASSGSLLRRSSLEQKTQGSASNVRAVHHLKPLGKQGSSNLPALDKGLCLDAPWDSMGRPKTLFPKK